MPGAFVVNTEQTFALLVFMGSAPKTEYGTDNQAVSPAGEKKWECQVGATWRAEPGRRAASDVLSVTITGPATDPGEGVTLGAPVELPGLRVGVSKPEAKEGGRVWGGKPWYQAEAVRTVNGQHRPGVKADA
jgi:hypothetical protein